MVAIRKWRDEWDNVDRTMSEYINLTMPDEVKLPLIKWAKYRLDMLDSIKDMMQGKEEFKCTFKVITHKDGKWCGVSAEGNSCAIIRELTMFEIEYLDVIHPDTWFDLLNNETDLVGRTEPLEVVSFKFVNKMSHIREENLSMMERIFKVLKHIERAANEEQTDTN